ncbi:hypothetical protein ACLB2K_036793 [Fragaria x ananassa]
MELSRCLKAYWSSSSRNKTAEHFTAPEEFDPSSFENGKAAPAYSNIPFGSGSRICQALSESCSRRRVSHSSPTLQ